MKKLLLSASVAILMMQSADAAYAQYWPPRGTQPHVRYAPYGPRPYGPPYAYAYRPQEPRGPNPLDFFGAFLGAIPMIAGAIPPQPYYPPPPQYQTPQTQTQYDPRDPNLYLEEYRVTKQEVEAAMQQYCSEHGETVVCQKIENMMRQQRRP